MISKLYDVHSKDSLAVITVVLDGVTPRHVSLISDWEFYRLSVKHQITDMRDNAVARRFAMHVMRRRAER